MSFRTLRALAVAVVALASIAVPAAQADSVQVGSSAWFWGNPLPQGNTLTAMSFAGGQGYAAGQFGTLLKTGDGGATFTRIAFTNVESSCPSALAAMSFVSANTGFIALKDGTVIATDDGGQTFASKVAIPGSSAVGGYASPTDMYFLTSTKGFVTAGDKVYRTLDGGSSWTEVGSGGTLFGITFADANTGYAVGISTFLKTTDGGATWNPMTSPAGTTLTNVSCASTQLCVATTYTGNVLVRTDDGGTSFTTPSPSTAPILAAAFNSTTQLAAGGSGGTQVTSSDGGVTFAPVGSRLSGTYTAIRAGNQANTAFAPGADGALGKTIDGGNTWTRANVTTSEDIRDVAFASASNGYALDSSGGMFLTTNGASTWKPLDPGTKNGRALASPSSGTVLLVGSKGVRRSINSGASFSGVSSRAVKGKSLWGAERLTNALAVFGSKNIAVSKNDGKTFKAIKKPKKAKKIKAIDFATAKLVFVIGSDGRVWRTTNAGKKWAEVPAAGTNGGYDVQFSDSKHGYLLIRHFGDASQDGGWVLQTADGGKTWFPQFVVSQTITGLATGGTADYILGGSSSLLFSNPNSSIGAGAPSTLTIKTAKRKLKKATTIKVTGKLTGAEGNERVAVLYRKPGKTTWSRKMATVGASGTFTTSWKVTRGANQFVAQWAGDFHFKGDGSPVLTVTAKEY